MLNSSSILYLFDFDGTLMGENTWNGFIKSTMCALKTEAYYNPSDDGIRWYVLTARPLIDKPIVWYACNSKGLHPRSIITQPTWFYDESINPYQFKVDFITGVLDQKYILSDDVSYDKVFYIDNDIDCVKYVNDKMSHRPCMAMSIFDFKRGTFNFVL